MTLSYSTPGVYFEQVRRIPQPTFGTGVPAFLGSVPSGLTGPDPVALDTAVGLDASAFAQLDARFGATWAGGYLPFAVRGFFQNGGSRCYVVRLGASSSLSDGLALIDPLDDIDLVCAPDLALSSGSARLDGQVQLIDFCEGRGAFAGRPPGCFAILDSIGAPLLTNSAGVDVAGVKDHRDALVSRLTDPAMGASAALYAPWVKVPGAGFVPPCGHVAGVYASTDLSTGVHKAPANQALQGVLDLEIYFDDAAQASLDPMPGPGAASPGRRLNCLRAFPGRGSRIWGAGTLSLDPTWTYVNVRRLTLTLQRWFAFTMTDVAFETNDIALWIRITSAVSEFLEALYEHGAFQGGSPDEAFYVKCDAETNPASVRDAGMVVTEVGIAPARPGEFIVLRLVSGDSPAQDGP
jgi:hypothetical protein